MKNIVLGVVLASVMALGQATTTTYTGTGTTTANCIPFGCPASYGPHMGFVYKDIAAFSLQAGDIIAFDTGATVSQPLHLDLSLAATTVNGGDVATSAGFTRVASLAPGVYGNTVVGDYDIAFKLDTAFTFAGGGLIVDFMDTGTFVGNSAQNLVSSYDSPYNVERYYRSTSAGPSSSKDANVVGIFEIQTVPHNVPEPGSLALLGLGMASLAALRRKKRN